MKKKIARTKQLLNPGSIGQPRNKKCGASWMILDTNSMTFQILRTNYDHKRIKKQVMLYDQNNLKISKYFNKCN
jgi:predicted phosphodiesterase